jgi:hypothetical protein
MMRLIPMASAAIAALVGTALAGPTVNAATADVNGSFILAAEETTSPTPTQDKVQGSAPHTGTGLGKETPPADSLGSPRPGTAPPNKVQGTAPHTGTGLGKGTQPPAQTQGETPAEMDDIKKGTSEGNVSPSERKMGEKPSP